MYIYIYIEISSEFRLSGSGVSGFKVVGFRVQGLGFQMGQIYLIRNPV